ncbi:hypothetical protein [Streptomyces sp. TRM68367]|uniref:hypothetical protein n=1 Tax=Streptomyces sp. TRM68367 TaxID=2758415 RepID=UPI00165B3847|nr:hypothetical protein [Streptomyces sp. TRM68367]MBC9730728.1 hypothetical protein [Streptomyces sp. TRM68367]
MNSRLVARLLTRPWSRLGEWRRRSADVVRHQLGRLGAADRAALCAALPALRTLAVTLREEADET